MIFKDSKVYDTLKVITTVILPAIGTLYLTLSRIWGLPYGEEIAATIMAVVTFLGVVLGISSSKYKKSIKEQDTFNEDTYEEMKGVPHHEDTDISAEQ